MELMNRTTDQPVRPGSKIEHPSAVDAEKIVRERLKTIDADAEHAGEWPAVKERILKHKPQPRR